MAISDLKKIVIEGINEIRAQDGDDERLDAFQDIIDAAQEAHDELELEIEESGEDNE